MSVLGVILSIIDKKDVEDKIFEVMFTTIPKYSKPSNKFCLHERILV